MKYKMIRLRAETHAQLVAMRERLFSAYQNGSVNLPDAVEPSLDFIINRLIRHFQDHSRRRDKARNKARHAQD